VLSDAQLLLLFFGLPLVILGMGLRRATGNKGFLLVLLTASLVAVYAGLLEAGLRAAGHGLPLPGARTAGLSRGFGLYALSASILGALGGIMMRYRTRGTIHGL
jgi:hypothetical protein